MSEALQWYIGAEARSLASLDDVARIAGREDVSPRVESIKCCFRFLDPWSDGKQIQNRAVDCCCVAAAVRVPWSQMLERCGDEQMSQPCLLCVDWD